MKAFPRPRLVNNRPNPRLRMEALEDRAVPSATAPEFDPGTVAVVFRTADPGANPEVRAEAVPPGQTVDQAVAGWLTTPGVATAEPNYVYRPAVIPNDTRFGSQYAQHNATTDIDVDAPEAWDVTTGSPRTVVAVIDTGVDFTHPDLYKNIWINEAEIPSATRAALTDVDADGIITFYDLNDPVNIGAGKATDGNGNGRIDGGDLIGTTSARVAGWEDGVDTDGNGKVDDLVGWDFYSNDNDPLDRVADGGAHGTHVSGTIGAMGNNALGVAGMAWRVRIMPVRFLGPDGGSTSAGIQSIDYSSANGAVVSNNSWGGGGFSTGMRDAIVRAETRGQVFVAAAGNNGTDNDTTPFYPANYNVANVVSVAATDRVDALASWSNYGRTTVDLAAPGVSIISTYPGTGYTTMSGTSMAAPQVSGAFALVRSQSPGLSVADAVAQLLGGVDPVASVATRTITGGRLNAAAGLAPVVDLDGPAVTSLTPNATGSSPVSAVRVVFDEPVAAASFAPADVAVSGPGGGVAVASVAAFGADGKTFDITFTTAQSAAGNYTVAVGPDVTDTAGNPMDQDGDGVNGEPGQDVFNGGFVIDPPSAGTTFSNTTPTPIAEPGATRSRITVDRDLTISSLTVRLNITHPNTSDMVITLTSPTGTAVRLFNRRGGSGDNLTGTVFSDAATTPISAGTAPFAGTFRPEAALAPYNGRNARGVWTLTVTDYVIGNTGTLLDWSMTFNG
ncbi:MAG: S8 family serine peptidase [Gemmataceae bacterium]|nr:S8 family serine peptidase [Gemmataceae bacterium]